MRSKLLNLDVYDTDKIKHGYLDVYTQFWHHGSMKRLRSWSLVFIGEARSNYGATISLTVLSLASIASSRRISDLESVFRSSRAAMEIRGFSQKSLIGPLRTDLTSS